MKVFTMTTSRQNLHYEVRYKAEDQGVDHYDDFLRWLKAVHKRRSADPVRRSELEARHERLDNVSGIIYTLRRKDCEDIAARLRGDGIGAKPYHAGLSNTDKTETLTRWVNDEVGYDIIVATTAFGMGIDKENVRFVVHWQLPKSFEGFYQEAGRAGRDGKASICMMYYSREDRDRALHMIGPSKKDAENRQARIKSLTELVKYCENTSACRHALICKYFGETATPICDYACDWHKDSKALRRAKADGLASEEWMSTQREIGRYDDDGYGGYDGYD